MKYGDSYGLREERGEALALPPWDEDRFRLLSLWEMLQFAAGRFVQAIIVLDRYSRALERLQSPVSMRVAGELLRYNEELREQLNKLGLRGAEIAAQRLSKMLELNPEPDAAMLRENMEDVVSQVDTELAAVFFLRLSLDERRFYESAQPLFGVQVTEHFPSATYDIEEAGKCFALNRYTACVFHLMRALEVCLTVLARELGILLLRAEGNNWDHILNQIDQVLQAQLQNGNEFSSPQLRGRVEFYSGAAALLKNVNNAWLRSMTSVRRIYDQERARRIFNVVGEAMRHLATTLREEELTA
jgi:hypothetical protein